jgi:type 1 fimbria pilin
MRNKTAFILSAVVLLGLALVSPSMRADGEKTFIGEIADSQCALGVHSLDRSHQTMIKMGNAGKTAADCTRYCVKERGGRFVLQTKSEVYKLDNQDLAEKNAGLKVKVTGTLDTKTNIILIGTIEPIPAK